MNNEKIAEGFHGQKAIITPYNIRKYQSENPITRKLFVTHIGYYPLARSHFREREEGANENILIYCADGTGWVTVGENTVRLGKHNAYIIPAQAPHSYGAGSFNPWSIYWIHFLGEDSGLFSYLMDNPIVLREADNSRYEDRIGLFAEMYRNLEMGYSPENLEYVSICLHYFLASLKYVNQFREIKSVKEEDVIQRSIRFMKDNLEKRVTLEEMASHAGYSVSHFGTIFAGKTSYPPMVYYMQLKIQRACSLLQFSDLKINEIAFRLCFYDPFHFSKAFKQEMEISPREYRKRYHRDYNTKKG